MNDMDMNLTETKDFYKESGNEEKAKYFSNHIGVEFEYGKEIFLDLFLYSHGIAVLTATEKLSLDITTVGKNVIAFFNSIYRKA